MKGIWCLLQFWRIECVCGFCFGYLEKFCSCLRWWQWECCRTRIVLKTNSIRKAYLLDISFFLSLGFQDSDFLAGKYRSPVIYSFTCSICGTVLKTKRNYQRHMVMHSTARPHQCSLCDKSFKRQDHLKKHVDSVHLKKIP